MQEVDSGIIAANEVVEKFVKNVELAKIQKRRFFLVGDSTVGPFEDDFFLPRNGYGMKIQDFIDEEKCEVVNLAISGRSSKSFLIEKNYEVLKEFLKKDDYLLIAFGHNDEKLEEARYSDANGTKETAGAFKNFLSEFYVKLACDVGAIPILCTPIVRRSPDGIYSGVFVHITPDEKGFKGGDYPKAIRELADETKTVLVDMTLLTKNLYEKLSAMETAKFHSQKTDDSATLDNTHLNSYGASVIAKIVVEEIAKQDSIFAGFAKL